MTKRLQCQRMFPSNLVEVLGSWDCVMCSSVINVEAPMIVGEA